MNDENPYATPQIAEPEAHPSRVWQVDGLGVLVKNQAVLPPVDLNTGETGEGMQCVRRTFVNQASGFSLITWVILMAYLFFPERAEISPPVMFLGLFVVLFLLKQVQALRASPSDRLHVMEYVGPQSIRGYIARTRWRKRINLVLLAGILASLFLPYVTDLPLHLDLPFFAAILCGILGTKAWGIADAPPAKSQAGPPGWMRITPIHQAAHRHLSELQHQESKAESGPAEIVRRKIRTSYYYKYPLSSLLGHNRSPLAIFNVFIAKLVRSRLLVRDTFHFSEAVPVDPATLNPALKEKIATWTTPHPDWTVRTAERLVFPDGDVIVETVHLAPPTLEHDLSISCSWSLATPGRQSLHSMFITWLERGGNVTTHDMPFIHLHIPGYLPFRSHGGLDGIYQDHLRNCAGKAPTDTPADEAGRVERVHTFLETMDRLLTELGYQSELR